MIRLAMSCLSGRCRCSASVVLLLVVTVVQEVVQDEGCQQEVAEERLVHFVQAKIEVVSLRCRRLRLDSSLWKKCRRDLVCRIVVVRPR